MKPDSEGFLRPVIAGDACVDCGLCQKTCPVNHPIEDDLKVPMAFAARHKDENIRHVSSSGGAFSALAMNILSRGGVVIAAGFDQQHVVVHKVCTDVSLLDELRRSKYVQSDINGTFQQAETFLQAGREVIFCGTPCQVGGLCAYLKKDYPNLYTVDFICHGVPSPTAWKKYLEYCETNAGVAVKLVNFRSKVKGWKTFSMEITFEDGTKFSNTVREDMYLRSFIMDMDLRPSCYQCQFKQIHRQADITIADFWETRLLNKAWNDDIMRRHFFRMAERKDEVSWCNRNRFLIGIFIVKIAAKIMVGGFISCSCTHSKSPFKKSIRSDLSLSGWILDYLCKVQLF